MENASKALLMGAGTLLAILIIFPGLKALSLYLKFDFILISPLIPCVLTYLPR